MPRLAIVIPAVDGVESLESTLLSVLENRPHDCEIVVAADFGYADPYQLQGEVRFVETPRRAGFTRCAQLGIAASRSPIVHLLAAGCVASEGWADRAMSHFREPRVAAVAPLVLDSERQDRVVVAGIDYRVGGSKRLRRSSLAQVEKAGARPVFGASVRAMFLRKSAWDQTVSSIVEAGATGADVELALSLRREGLTTVMEPAARVYAFKQSALGEGAFRQGLNAERLFWRNAPQMGLLRSLAAHLWTVGSELLGSPVRPSLLVRLVGRLVACCQFGHYRRHYDRLRTLNERPEKILMTLGGRQRIDGPHSGASRSEQSYEQRAKTA